MPIHENLGMQRVVYNILEDKMLHDGGGLDIDSNMDGGLGLPEDLGGTPLRLSASNTPSHLMREYSIGLRPTSSNPYQGSRSRRDTGGLGGGLD
jgi:hypothetical protein